MILEFKEISKKFFGVPVLRKISFSVQRGQVLGLIGENGAGKTTLMNILAGVITPDAGKMQLFGSSYAPRSPLDSLACGIAFIHQELNLFPNLSIAENIFISGFPEGRLPGLFDRRQVLKKTQAALKLVHLDVAPHTLVERLSPGERQLVEIAKALSFDARLIIFDEPTSSLSSHEVRHLFALINQLRQRGISVIYISHALNEVLQLCDVIVVLRDGEVVVTGSRAEFTEPALIKLMVGRSIDQLFPPRTQSPSNRSVLQVIGLSQAGLVKGIDFALRQGEVLGVYGLMGSGRTELARILFGLENFETGQITLNGVRLENRSVQQRIALGMAFVTENRREEGLLMEAGVAQNLALVALPQFARSRLGSIEEDRMHSSVQMMSDRLRIRGVSAERQPVKSLSGGNQQKVVIGKWILCNASVYVLDEPTRGIDVGAKHEVYRTVNKLAADGAGILFISSDIEELIGMCDRIMVMRKGEVKTVLSRHEFDRQEILRIALGSEEAVAAS